MLRAIAIITIIIVGARLSHAEVRGDKNAAKPHVVAGDTAYKLGKFDEALASYAKAYELYPAPALLFNLGQCHRNLKNLERAVFFYEGYLRESPANAPNRKFVEDVLKETRLDLEREHAAKRAADEAAAKAEEAARLEAARIKAQNDAKIEAEKAAAQREAERLAREEQARRDREAFEAKRLREQREREQRERPTYKKWWFWSAAAVVVAGAGAAYYFSGDTTVLPPSGSLGGLDRR